MQKIVLTFAAAALAAVASAYTVYDAGKALRQNCASGAYTGANGDSYYTDENGGKWQFRLSSEQGVFANVTFPSGTRVFAVSCRVSHCALPIQCRPMGAA